MMPLLPAPRIAGLLPPPRYAPVPRVNLTHWSGPGIWITTIKGTFAVLDEARLGESFAELVQAQGKVELVEVRQLALFEEAA